MKLVVAGGTGLVGRFVVSAAQAGGHDVTVLSRRRGVDLVGGTGLADALRGADVVIDVSNSAGIGEKKSVDFFQAATSNLLAAGAAAGVAHHLALSIVGVDRVPWGYYAGKVRQETLIEAGGLPWTVLRATQFHQFAEQLLAQLKGPVLPVPRMRSATVAASEVADYLLELATGPARGRATELSGPQVHSMPDLVRAVLAARGQRRLVLPVRMPGKAGAGMAGDGLLPSRPGRVGNETFDEWLNQQALTP